MGGDGPADELRGLILLDATLPKAWERVALLKFGERLGEPATHHVYLEVQGRCALQPPLCVSSRDLRGCQRCVGDCTSCRRPSIDGAALTHHHQSTEPASD